MLIHVEMTSKRVPTCPGCEFAVETEDGRVYCGNHDCIFYLRSTTCRCKRPTLSKKEDKHVG